MKICRENLELADSLQHSWTRAFTLRIIGDNELGLHGIESARPWYAEAIRLARRVGDPWLLAMSLRSIALVDAVSGDFEPTRALFEESIALSRKVGDRWGLSYNLLGYGYAAVHANQIAEARRLFKEGYTMACEVDSVTVAVSDSHRLRGPGDGESRCSAGSQVVRRGRRAAGRDHGALVAD